MSPWTTPPTGAGRPDPRHLPPPARRRRRGGRRGRGRRGAAAAAREPHRAASPRAPGLVGDRRRARLALIAGLDASHRSACGGPPGCPPSRTRRPRGADRAARRSLRPRYQPRHLGPRHRRRRHARAPAPAGATSASAAGRASARGPSGRGHGRAGRERPPAPRDRARQHLRLRGAPMRTCCVTRRRAERPAGRAGRRVAGGLGYSAAGPRLAPPAPVAWPALPRHQRPAGTPRPAIRGAGGTPVAPRARLPAPFPLTRDAARRDTGPRPREASPRPGAHLSPLPRRPRDRRRSVAAAQTRPCAPAVRATRWRAAHRGPDTTVPVPRHLLARRQASTTAAGRPSR